MDIVHRAGRVHCNVDCLSRCSEGTTQDDTGARQDEGPQVLLPSACLAYLATTTDDMHVPGDEDSKQADIWMNVSLLRRVQELMNLHHYCWQEGKLWKTTGDMPREIQHVHDMLGHFGVKQTYSMLRSSHWWTGMYRQVEEVLQLPCASSCVGVPQLVPMLSYGCSM